MVGHNAKHSGEHVDGTDDIQDSTAAQKGLATSTQIGKLDGIAPNAVDDTGVSANADVAANTTHRSSDGKDHSDVVLNNTHRGIVSGNPHVVTVTEIGAEPAFTKNTAFNKDFGFTASDVPRGDLIQKLTEKDAANGYAGLDAGSKINPSQLPAMAITETFVVASEAAQLALTIQEGDVAVRTDENKSYINTTGLNVSMADWQELLTPTDAVASIFGRIGIVTAQNGDYTGSQVTNVPAGTIAGTTVQAAIDELDSEKATPANITTDIATHAGLPNVHHTKYLDTEAVTAMGVKGDGNPLNHDRPIQAAETIVGIAEIATQVEADAGTDDTKMITPLKLANYPISATDLNAIHDNVSAEISAIAGKTTPINADVIVIEDSAATFAKKKITWANLKATLKTYMDTLYANISHTHTHASTTGQTVNDHHTKSHNHDVASGSGAIATDQISKFGDGGTTNYIQIATNGILSMFGAARVNRSIQFYPYNIGGISGTYNGIVCAASGLASLNGFYFISFDDTIEEVINIEVLLPDNYVDGSDISIEFHWTSGGTSTNNCRWQAGLTNVPDGGTFSPSTYAWATPQNIAGPGVTWKRKTTVFTLSGTGLVKGDVVSIIVFRDAANAADTLAGDTYMSGIHALYLSDKLGG